MFLHVQLEGTKGAAQANSIVRRKKAHTSQRDFLFSSPLDPVLSANRLSIGKDRGPVRLSHRNR